MPKTFEVPVEEFRSMLSIAKGYTQTRGLVPVLGCFCFLGNRIMAFNGKAGFRGASGWDAGKSGIGIAAPQLTSLLSLLPGEKALCIKVDDGKVNMACESFKGSFTLREVTDFPAIEEPKKNKEFPTEVWEAVQKLSFSVSQDETKKPLRGIQIGGSEKYPAAYSSDSYRISRMSLEKGFDAPVLLPDNLLVPIVSSSAPPTGYVLTDNTLWMYFQGYSVHGLLLAEKFPDVEPFFAKSRGLLKRGIKVVFDPAAVQLSMERLLLFSPDVLQAVTATISPGSEVAVLKAEGETGSAEEKVPVEHAAKKEVTVKVNGKFFAEAVSNAKTCFIGGEPGDPLYFREEGFEHLLLCLT